MTIYPFHNERHPRLLQDWRAVTPAFYTPPTGPYEWASGPCRTINDTYDEVMPTKSPVILYLGPGLIPAFQGLQGLNLILPFPGHSVEFNHNPSNVSVAAYRVSFHAAEINLSKPFVIIFKFIMKRKLQDLVKNESRDQDYR